MELVAHYVEVHKPIDPFQHMVKSYLKAERIPPYQQKIIEHLEKNPVFPNRVQERRMPSIRFSQEMLQDASFDVANQLFQSASREMARRMEEEVYRSLMNSTGAINFSNGSSIDLTRRQREIEREATRDVMERYGIYPHGIHHIESPMEFQREYMGEWIGDRDGDVSPVHDDSR